MQYRGRVDHLVRKYYIHSWLEAYCCSIIAVLREAKEGL